MQRRARIYYSHESGTAANTGGYGGAIFARRATRGLMHQRIGKSPAASAQLSNTSGGSPQRSFIQTTKHDAGRGPRREFSNVPIHSPDGSVTGSAEEQQPARSSGASGLPEPLKSGIEGLSGIAMDRVRVHYNSAKPAALNALAYTQGSDIHVARGQERHLPHEAWHVVQQARGRVRPRVQLKTGAGINDDPLLEREADLMGAKASVAPGNSPANLKPLGSGAPVAQRVRGGIEFTEDTPATLDSYVPPPVPGGGAVARSALWTIHGSQVSAFIIPDRDAAGDLRDNDHTLMESGQVKLTNDVYSAEWIIARHGADVTPAVMRTNMNADLTLLFDMRSALATRVAALVAANPGSQIALANGSYDTLDAVADPQGVFIYVPGTSKGKAQITIQYSNTDTIRRINLLNTSKFVTGTKVAQGEDVSRVAGTHSRAAQLADLAGTTSFSTAGALLTNIVAGSHAIGGVLSQHQVGLIKLMVLNDALSTTMVRYAARLGQAEAKNLQRFFPKSRRDEYSKAIAGAAISGPNMILLRAEINRTAAADAQLFYNSSDVGALRVDEAFNEITDAEDAAAAAGAAPPPDAALIPGMIATRTALALNPAAVVAPADIDNIRRVVLGANGATLATWIGRAANAYTDVTPGGAEQYQAPGGHGNVIRSTAGFTPKAGAAPGAIYEFRERETGAEEPTWRNVWGGLDQIKAALNALFTASQ